MTRREMIRSMCLAAMGLALPTPPAAAAVWRGRAAPLVGVCTHLLDERSFRALRELGVTHIRFSLYWHLWETTATYKVSWAEQVRRARREGLQPLAVVHSDAQDPVRGWGGWVRRDAVLARFTRFMQARVREMPGMAWQLWNEPEAGFTDLFGALGGHGTLEQRGRWYGQWLRTACPAIRAADPTCTLVAAGIAGGAGHDAFIRGYLSMAPDAVDVVAAHAYWPDFAARVRAARQAAGGRPLWITEFGAAEGDDAAHRRRWESMIATGTELGVARMYGYALWAEEPGMGLLRQDWRPRPAAEMLRARFGARRG